MALVALSILTASCGSSKSPSREGGAGGQSGGVDATLDVPADFGAGGTSPTDAPDEGNEAGDVPVETVADLDANAPGDAGVEGGGQVGNLPTPNACGCLEVGARCTGAGIPCCGSERFLATGKVVGVQCVSGICGGDLCVANGLAVDASRPCCSGKSRDGTCVGPDVCRPQGAACDGQLDCCPGFGCYNGKCMCAAGGNFELPLCGPAMPCCNGLACLDNGGCVPPPAPASTLPPGPACMPLGGLCDQAHKCCAGAPCCNGFCGSHCMAAGQPCDDLHICCLGGCVNGKCDPTTVSPGRICTRASGDPCGPQDFCCGGSCVNGHCHQSGHADNGYACDNLGIECGATLTCVLDVCRIPGGCILRGLPFYDDVSSCCSGSVDTNLRVCL